MRDRPVLDLRGAAHKSLAPFLGQPGNVMGAIDLLQEEIYHVGKPGQHRVSNDEVVKAVAVQDEDLSVAAPKDVFLDHLYAQKVGDHFGRAVMVPGDPNNLDPVRQLSEQRQNFPVVLLEPAKVKRIKDVAVQYEFCGRAVGIGQAFQEIGKSPGLAVRATKVQVREDNGVVHVIPSR
jgi:hypothetical protein